MHILSGYLFDSPNRFCIMYLHLFHRRLISPCSYSIPKDINLLCASVCVDVYKNMYVICSQTMLTDS